MERFQLTPIQQAAVDEFKAQRPELIGVQPILEGTNIIEGDQLELVSNPWFQVEVIAGEGGVVHSVCPWGDVLGIDLRDYVTDRAGPNGETMPIVDGEEPPPEEEPAAATTFQGQQQQQQPQHAKAKKPKGEQTLEALLRAQTPEVAKRIRDGLKQQKK